MVLRNFQPKNDIVNSSLYGVESMTNDVLFKKIVSETNKEKRRMFTRVLCEPADYEIPILGFKKTQIPVRVFLAITTNKVQDQLFRGVIELNLYCVCFTHGKHYVAMSRMSHSLNIYVFKKRDENITTNAVY